MSRPVRVELSRLSRLRVARQCSATGVTGSEPVCSYVQAMESLFLLAGIVVQQIERCRWLGFRASSTSLLVIVPETDRAGFWFISVASLFGLR